MKVRTIERKTGQLERECVGDVRKQSRHLDPKAHPMVRAREYQRAKTSAKLSRMFAKPFVGDFGRGHADAVLCSRISRTSLLPLVSGSADGSVHLWDVTSRKLVQAWTDAHSKAVNDVVFDRSSQYVYSCSDDGYIRCWKASATNSTSTAQAIASWRGAAFKSIDHHYHDPLLATASSDSVQIWSPERTTAISEFSDLWGSSDSVTVVRYHPAERSLLAQCAMDRGIGLHDTRTSTDLKKVILKMRSNDLCWNPMEPMTFAVANEDGNAYAFDMRQLHVPVKIYKGHQGAVLSIAYAPTGRELVTGSYDRTIRLWETKAGWSRDIYHTKRMQRAWTVQYSLDAQWVISGSEDSNLRLWKAQADAKLGQKSVREETSLHYRAALVKRYQHLPEIRRIAKHRKIPKAIRNQAQQARLHQDSQQRKQANRVKYSSKDRPHEQHKFTSEKDTVVVKQVE